MNTLEMHNHDSHYLLGYFGITPSSKHTIECSQEGWYGVMMDVEEWIRQVSDV